MPNLTKVNQANLLISLCAAALIGLSVLYGKDGSRHNTRKEERKEEERRGSGGDKQAVRQDQCFWLDSLLRLKLTCVCSDFRERDWHLPSPKVRVLKKGRGCVFLLQSLSLIVCLSTYSIPPLVKFTTLCCYCFIFSSLFVLFLSNSNLSVFPPYPPYLLICLLPIP